MNTFNKNTSLLNFRSTELLSKSIERIREARLLIELAVENLADQNEEQDKHYYLCIMRDYISLAHNLALKERSEGTAELLENKCVGFVSKMISIDNPNLLIDSLYKAEAMAKLGSQTFFLEEASSEEVHHLAVIYDLVSECVQLFEIYQFAVSRNAMETSIEVEALSA